MGEAPEVAGPPPAKRHRSKRRRKRVFPKSTFLLLIGVALLINEAFFQDKSDVALLATGLLLCGFPVAEIADTLRNAVVTSWETRDEEEADAP